MSQGQEKKQSNPADSGTNWVVIISLVILTLIFFIPVWGGYYWDWLNTGNSGVTRRNLGLIVFGSVVFGSVVFGSIGFAMVGWRTNIAERDTRKVEIADRNSVTDTFTKAVEQLGAASSQDKPNIEVRLGAIYTLEKLSRSDDDYYQAIIDILCSYVRQNSALIEEDKTVRVDVQTAMVVIGKRSVREDEAQLNLTATNLKEANLKGANLARAFLREANLQEADLTGADLTEANLQEAQLVEAYLLKAHLVEALLCNTNLTRANLREANLEGAYLQEADLTGGLLWNANLTGANLKRADLTRAELIDADLHGANLQAAELEGAILARADLVEANLAEADLERAILARADLKQANLAGADLKEANLDEANLAGADLRDAKNLTCEQLQQATDWEKSYRDPELACGADIPMQSLDATKID